MKAFKVCTVILGILMVLGGVWCAMTPGATYLSLAWIIAACMIADGLGGVFSYSERKKLGVADGWTLVGSILSIVFGVILLASWGMKLAMEVFITYMVAVWLVAIGVVRIFTAIKLQRFHKAADSGDFGKNWVWVLIAGILLVICGILGFIHPVVFALTIGMFVGIGIAMGGINLITLAFAK